MAVPEYAADISVSLGLQWNIDDAKVAFDYFIGDEATIRGM